MNTFQFVPYLGALPITFQMTPAEVEQVVGSVDEISYNERRERHEVRQAFIVRYYASDNKIKEMTFVPGAALYYAGRDLFQTEGLVDFLAGFDQPYESDGFIMFWKLGLTATGFHDGDDSQKAITVFRAGAWDHWLGDFTPYQVN